MSCLHVWVLCDFAARGVCTKALVFLNMHTGGVSFRNVLGILVVLTSMQCLPHTLHFPRDSTCHAVSLLYCADLNCTLKIAVN